MVCLARRRAAVVRPGAAADGESGSSSSSIDCATTTRTAGTPLLLQTGTFLWLVRTLPSRGRSCAEQGRLASLVRNNLAGRRLGKVFFHFSVVVFAKFAELVRGFRASERLCNLSVKF